MALESEIGERGHHVVVENLNGRGPFVILCDHASNNIPPNFKGLGLSEEQKQSHVAWDPGALLVARRMSERFDAPLLWPNVSRLIIDCNRAHDAPDLIPVYGEGQPVPGNANLSEADRDLRIEMYHAPYHKAVDELLDDRKGRGQTSALIAVHSYTPVFFGNERPWPIGILSDKDSRLADHLIAGLQSNPNLKVGVNEPYSPADGVYFTLTIHGDNRGLPNVMIEIRNDEIRSDLDCRQWADLLGDIVENADLNSRSGP